MKDINIADLSSEIFDITEDGIYDILDQLKKLQNIDQSITYIFIKAYYLNSAVKCMEKKGQLQDFNELFSNYKMNLEIYYKSNNPQITQEILNEISNAFDKSFELIQSLELTDIDDSYEYRHFTIDSFEILRKILEKKSKSEIREDIFDDKINIFIDESEKIHNFISECNIES